MRCLGCGVEMRLVRVVPDGTAAISGYAYHTFECPGCNDTETRLLFGRSPDEAAPATSRPAAADALSSAPEDGLSPALGAWGRALELLRSQQRALDERAAATGTSGSQPVAPPRAPTPVLPSRPSDEPPEPLRKPAVSRVEDPPSSSKWRRAISMLRRMQERP